MSTVATRRPTIRSMTRSATTVISHLVSEWAVLGPMPSSLSVTMSKKVTRIAALRSFHFIMTKSVDVKLMNGSVLMEIASLRKVSVMGLNNVLMAQMKHLNTVALKSLLPMTPKSVAVILTPNGLAKMVSA
jgi:hypothetical protein